MIQPTLICYSLSGPPQPILLDNTSIGADRILLLDAFFWITLWTGETIAAWRNQGYHEMAGYENVKQLLEDPREDLKDLIKDRFPVPRVIETDQHKSQARFLLAKLSFCDARVARWWVWPVSLGTHLHRRRESSSVPGASFQ